MTNLPEPKGIAIDWVTSKIYWTDSAIQVADMSSGGTRITLISKKLYRPFSIVVNPSNG